MRLEGWIVGTVLALGGILALINSPRPAGPSRFQVVTAAGKVMQCGFNESGERESIFANDMQEEHFGSEILPGLEQQYAQETDEEVRTKIMEIVNVIRDGQIACASLAPIPTPTAMPIATVSPVTDTFTGAKFICDALGRYRICHGSGVDKRCYSQSVSRSAGGKSEIQAGGLAQMECGNAMLMAEIVQGGVDSTVESVAECAVTKCRAVP